MRRMMEHLEFRNLVLDVVMRKGSAFASRNDEVSSTVIRVPESDPCVWEVGQRILPDLFNRMYT